jgi:hypothetical protein
MAAPLRTKTRRGVLSYDEVERLTEWPDLMVKDYQGILQDFVTVSDESDLLGFRVDVNSLLIAELAKKNPDNVVVINSLDDFEVQDDTTITLEDGKLYWQGADIVTPKRFIVGKNVTFTSGSLGASPILEYTGTDVVFTGVDMVTFYHQDHSIKATNAAEAYHFSDTVEGVTLFQMTNVLWRGTNTELAVKKAGTFNGLGTIDIVNSSYSGSIDGGLSLGVEDGLTVTGATTILSINKLAILSFTTSFIALSYVGATFSIFEISNLATLYFGTNGIAIEGDKFSANIAVGSLGTIRDCEFIDGGSGNLTPLAGVLTQDGRYNIQNCPPVEDSTIVGTLHFDGNTAVTTMTGPGVPTSISAVWADGDIEQRVCFSDKVTFDNTTNTCTSVDGAIDATGGTAFNHGLSNGAEIAFLSNAGIPSEITNKIIYYVGDVTATTFRAYEDELLTTLVTFSTDGTEPNYYCQRSASSASGWSIYTGDGDAPIGLNGWVSIEKNSGGSAELRTVIMKTDASYNVTRLANGSKFEGKNGITGASQVSIIDRFAQFEGIIIYIENVTGSADNVVTDARITHSKA